MSNFIVKILKDQKAVIVTKFYEHNLNIKCRICSVDNFHDLQNLSKRLEFSQTICYICPGNFEYES